MLVYQFCLPMLVDNKPSLVFSICTNVGFQLYQHWHMILKFQCWYLYHISNVGTLLKDTNKKPVKFQQNPNVSPMLVCLIFFPFVNSQLNSVSTSSRRHLYIRISWYFNKTPLLGVFIFLKKKMIKQIYPVVMTTLLKSKKSLWWVLTNCKPASHASHARHR